MKFKIFISIFIIFGFSGCRFFWEQKDILQKPIINSKQHTKSAIKGIITDLVYQNGLYCYVIKATDTSNFKLESASFCSNKYHHNKGDLVYATFVGQNLQSMLLINSAKKQDTIKRGKKPKKINISPAKEINIKFD